MSMPQTPLGFTGMIGVLRFANQLPANSEAGVPDPSNSHNAWIRGSVGMRAISPVRDMFTRPIPDQGRGEPLGVGRAPLL